MSLLPRPEAFGPSESKSTQGSLRNYVRAKLTHSLAGERGTAFHARDAQDGYMVPYAFAATDLTQ